MNTRCIRTVHTLLAITCLTLFAGRSIADTGSSGINVVTGLGLEIRQLQFSEKFQDISHKTTADPKFKTMLPMVNASATLSYKKAFATIKYDTTVATTETGSSEHTQTPGQYMLQAPGGSVGVDRQDGSFTFGYNVWDRLNVFAGYLYGQTTLTPHAYCASFVISGFFQWTCNSANLAYIRAEFLSPAKPNVYVQKYTEQGPYLGVSYSWQIAETGMLSASAAYAKMDGTYRDNFNIPGTQPNLNYSGDSNGTSVGLTWTAPLGESSSYFIDLREQAYTMHGRTTGNNPNVQYLQSHEVMDSLTAGLQVYF